jgi:hypothetical protein
MGTRFFACDLFLPFDILCIALLRYYDQFYRKYSSFLCLCSIYYQNNLFFEVPQSCAGHFPSTKSVTLEALRTCPALEAAYLNFTSVNCAESFETICQAEYTDNPPFSCTDSETPDFLTTLGDCRPVLHIIIPRSNSLFPSHLRFPTKLPVLIVNA